jgi:hypothetical protein
MPLVLMFVVALAAGLAGGYVRGGRLEALLGLRLAATVLVPLAVGLQLAAGTAPPSLRPLLIVVSYCVGGTWLALNARGRGGRVGAGLALLAAGWLLNLVPIVANGAMPVSSPALRATGASKRFRPEQGHLWKHRAAGTRTAMPWLGDVMPLSRVRTVISVGDVLLLLGVAATTAGAMTAAPGDDRVGGVVSAAAG